MEDIWQTVFINSFREFLKQVGSVLPHLLLMMAILALGILTAWVIKSLVFRLLKTVNLDQFCRRIGLSQTLNRGGVTEAPSRLISRITYWTITIIFLILGLGALNLKLIDQFVVSTLSYLPHLVVANAIVIAGVILGNFFGRATLIAAVNAQLTQANLLARGVRLAVILFSLAMAFEQMGVATAITVAAFSIAFGGVVLALAIAFGLGAKDVAKSFVERRFKSGQKEKEEHFAHY
jgi:hypothetical protein